MDTYEENQAPLEEPQPEIPVFTPVPPRPGLGLVRSLLIVLMVAVFMLEALLFSALWLVGSMDPPPAALSQVLQAAGEGQADAPQPAGLPQTLE